MELLHKTLTERIIKCYYRVYNHFGYGFLEKVYERAMMIELFEEGLSAQSQYPVQVYYKNKLVGDYWADILVEGKIILELKAAECVAQEHEMQLINYLKATDVELGLLLNFGKKPVLRRKIFMNARKSLATTSVDPTKSGLSACGS